MWKTKFNQDAYIGPIYTVTEVRNNGIVRARKGNVTDTYNLLNINPPNILKDKNNDFLLKLIQKHEEII